MDNNPFKNKQNQKKTYVKFNKNFKRAYNNPHGRGSYSQKPTYGDQKPQRSTSLLEHEVGITEYLSTFKGFSGVIKSRFQDFHVNEIDMEGNVLYLSDLTVPKPEVKILTDDELNGLMEDTKDFITDENWKLIEELSKDQSSCPSFKIEVTDINKDRRTQLHNVIRQKYGGRIISNTIVEKDDKKFMEFKANIKGKNNQEKRRKKWPFPEGDHVHFLLHKENVDTTEVTYSLAQSLGIKPSNVNYCGNKDKRANTTQKCSIKQCEPSNIVQAAMKIPRVKVGNFTIEKNPVKLGYLRGNRFRIAIRYVDGSVPEMDAALQYLREFGCINYFGMQRFGNNAEVPTWEIGIALLQNNYKLATELILKPRMYDLPFMADIRKTWWRDRNSSEALAMFKKHNKSIEKQILRGLAHFGDNDYCAALRQVPRNLLMLYPHALQSLIFNYIASRRIKEFGVKLMVGDLVYPSNLDFNEELIYANEENENESEEDDGKKPKEEPIKTVPIKVLTQKDIDSGDYSIFDVLLTLPGFDVNYPANDVGKWYEEYLSLYKIKFGDFRNKNKTFAISGTYRKLLLRPEDVSWEFCAFDKPDLPLIATDLDKLWGKEINLIYEGAHRALILNFNLPSSCYATMVIRELLKCDTSVSAQTELEKKIGANIYKDISPTKTPRQRSMSDSNISDVKFVNFLPNININATDVEKKEKIQRKRSASETKAEDDDETAGQHNKKVTFKKIKLHFN